MILELWFVWKLNFLQHLIFKRLNYFNFCCNFKVVIDQNDVTKGKNTKKEVVTMTKKVSFFLDLHLCLTLRLVKATEEMKEEMVERTKENNMFLNNDWLALQANQWYFAYPGPLIINCLRPVDVIILRHISQSFRHTVAFHMMKALLASHRGIGGGNVTLPPANHQILFASPAVNHHEPTGYFDSDEVIIPIRNF